MFQNRCRHRSGMLMACLALIGLLAPVNQPKAKAEPVTLTTLAIAGGFIVAKKLIAIGIDRFANNMIDQAIGKPDVYELQKDLSALASTADLHAEKIYQLQSAVSKAATKEELVAAFSMTMKQIDTRYSQLFTMIVANRQAADEAFKKQNKKIEWLTEDIVKLGNELGITKQELLNLTTRVNKLERRVEINERQIGTLRQEFDEFRRWNATEQAELLGALGAKALLKGDAKRAQEVFEQAVAYDPTDPGAWYMLAMALYEQKEVSLAGMIVAKGIAAERYKGPSQWYNRAIEREQGTTRMWLQQKRLDPILGARASGTIRVLELLPTTDDRIVNSNSR